MSCVISHKSNKSLTLIELLIVIGIIVVLAVIAIFVVQPGERAAKARDDIREVHLNAIWHAIEQKIYYGRGEWADCASIPTAARVIGSGAESEEYDLYSCLYSDFLADPFVDPKAGHFESLEDYYTGYEIWQNPWTKRISLLAAGGETRPVYLGDLEPPVLLGLGETCAANKYCESGYCIDDVCCDSACDGTCESCNIAGEEGYCTLADAGTDPRNDCGEEWVCGGSCTRNGNDGYCDGAGACRIVGTENIPSGYVCTGAGEVTPVSSSHYCDTAAANNNNCQYTTYYRACAGTGACRTDNTGAASAQTTCATNQATKGVTSCTAVTTANYCTTAATCNGTCIRNTSYYGCAGSGSTCESTVRTTSDPINCDAATYCSTGSCVSGYCNTCYDCVSGTCTAKTTSCGAGTYGCTGSTYFCSSGTCKNGANGQTCSVSGDCCSTYCYVDADGDRYVPSSGTKTCRANSQLSGTDCCDTEPNAWPGQVNCYSIARTGCGGYDYNCSGANDLCVTNCYTNSSCSNAATCGQVCTYATSKSGCTAGSGYVTCR